jgi:hypothetical protein
MADALKKAADGLLKIANDKATVATSGKTGDDINAEVRAKAQAWKKSKR